MRGGRILCLWAVFLLAGCAAVPETASPLRLTPAGMAVWGEEFTFRPPPSPWKLMRLPEDDYAFAYHREDPGPFPSQSTFAFAEEPFGYSRDLPERCREFFRRFLWASPVRFGEPATRPVPLLGGEGLEAVAEGVEPVNGQRVFAKVLFGRRGERVVAFYFTQWRPAGEPFDPTALEAYDRFVQSFRFLQPSFYQRLQGEGRP